MPRLTPSIEVRPLAGLIWYGLIIAIVIGALFAGGLGGAIAWLAFWLVVAFVVYAVGSRVWGRIA